MQIQQYLNRLNDDFALKSTQYKMENSGHLEFINDYFSRIMKVTKSKPEAVIQDVLGLIHYQHKRDAGLCEFIKDAMKLTDHEQSPNVTAAKESAISKIKTSEIEPDQEQGKSFVLNQIDHYKGDQLTVMLRDLKETLRVLDTSEKEQKDFINGAMHTIDHFSSVFRMPSTRKNNESTLSC